MSILGRRRRSSDGAGGPPMAYMRRYSADILGNMIIPRYARRRYRFSRFYQGRGVRSGTQQLRRYGGLRRYPQSGIETKFYDTFLSASALAAPAATTAWTGMEQNPATILCLNAPIQGTGASNREGRYITMESIQINGVITIGAQVDQSGADAKPVIKIWVVLDKQVNGGTTNGTGLDSENVFTNPGATAATGVSPLRNMLYTKRYKVLKELEVDISQVAMVNDAAAGQIEQEGQHQCFSMFIPLKGRKVEFTGSTAANGVVGDLTTNGLFVLAMTSSTSMAPSLHYNARLRFRG